MGIAGAGQIGHTAQPSVVNVAGRAMFWRMKTLSLLAEASGTTASLSVRLASPFLRRAVTIQRAG